MSARREGSPLMSGRSERNSDSRGWLSMGGQRAVQPMGTEPTVASLAGRLAAVERRLERLEGAGRQRAPKDAGAPEAGALDLAVVQALEITPEVLDNEGKYEIKDTIWDAMLVCGHSSVGTLSSFLLCIIWVCNVCLQITFIILCRESVNADATFSSPTLNSLLKFRLGVAHSADYADKVAHQSFAEMICNAQSDPNLDLKRLHMAGRQLGLYEDILTFENNLTKSYTFSLLVQLLWIITVFIEIMDTVMFSQAMRRLERSTRTEIWMDQDSDGSVSSCRVSRMSPRRVNAVFFLVCVPKALLAGFLFYYGSWWLANCVSLTDLLLNGLALAFVLDFDEALFSLLGPRRCKSLMRVLDPLPLPIESAGSTTLGKMVAVVAAAVFVWVWFLSPVYWQLNQASKIMCSGAQDFIYTVDPATGVTTFARTTDRIEDLWTSTEEALMRVVQADLEKSDTFWRKIGVDHAIIEAMGSDDLTHLPDDNAFDFVLRMSVWSTEEAARNLPCQDVMENGGQELQLGRLRQVMAPHVKIRDERACEDVPLNLCSWMNMTTLRALCPRHCGCHLMRESATGFFGTAAYGCPSQCSSVKASENEVFFRHKQMTEKPERCADVKPSIFEIGTCEASCLDMDCDVRNRVMAGCWYYESQEDCGYLQVYDDDDFTAEEICCVCGGGNRTGLVDPATNGTKPLTPASCLLEFTDSCRYLGRSKVAWMWYVRGLFEVLQHRGQLERQVEQVVDSGLIGVHEDNYRCIFDFVLSGRMAEFLANGKWEFAPGVPHPRGLQGCEFLASFEMKLLLGIDLCTPGEFSSILALCPETCRCEMMSDLTVCPAACSLPKTSTGFSAPVFDGDGKMCTFANPNTLTTPKATMSDYCRKAYQSDQTQKESAVPARRLQGYVAYHSSSPSLSPVVSPDDFTFATYTAHYSDYEITDVNYHIGPCPTSPYFGSGAYR